MYSLQHLHPALNVTCYEHIWQIFSMEKQIDQTVSGTLRSQTQIQGQKSDSAKPKNKTATCVREQILLSWDTLLKWSHFLFLFFLIGYIFLSTVT